MPIYDVNMHQAIAVADLAGNTLATGHRDANNHLASCAAVILLNPATRAAALYHYPSEAMDRGPGPKHLLRQVANFVQPTECHVLYGVWSLLSFGPSTEPTDPFHHDLIAFLETLHNPLPITRTAAPSGYATVSWSGTAFVVSTAALSPGGMVFLATIPSGVHPFGRLYSDHTLPPPAAAAAAAPTAPARPVSPAMKAGPRRKCIIL